MLAADVATIQKAKLPPLGTGTSWYEVVVAMGETQLDSNDEQYQCQLRWWNGFLDLVGLPLWLISS